MRDFFERLEKLKPVYDKAYDICMFICKIFLTADILITIYSVLGRYVPFISDPSWSEQVVLTLMSYMAVLSAALAIRKGSHIRMTAFDRFLPEKVIGWLDVLADAAVMALGSIMLIAGMNYALTIGRMGTYETIPWLSRFWMYFPVPLAGFFMIVFELETVTGHIRKLFIEEDKKQ